ncbi:MAG: hypothetical protein HY321_15885 [Armatimonadetes bacterium]|nr:hypothetical protein [Armatimonadota bacterium]
MKVSITTVSLTLPPGAHPLRAAVRDPERPRPATVPFTLANHNRCEMKLPPLRIYQVVEVSLGK